VEWEQRPSDYINNVYSDFLERYKKFTQIQKIAMPIIERGENCIIVAPTGSGKTEAAVLPAIDSILKTEGSPLGIKILYITPLRALNRDLIRRLSSMCEKAGISISVRHGDTTQSERRRQTQKAPVLLITTPETLQSILPSKGFRQHLGNVSFVIIDEIHELYSNKRGAQLSLGLERLDELAPNFKRIGISATIANPAEVGKFLCCDRGFEIATVNFEKKTGIKVCMPGPESKEGELIASKLGLDSGAAARLAEISSRIRESGSTLLFANTRQIVEALGSRMMFLNSMEPLGGIGVHHGSLDREERIAIEERFKEGKIKCLIATSSLELGIDVGKIDMVLQYGSPRQALRLVQRMGRSGHSEFGISKGAIIATSNIDAVEGASTLAGMKLKKLEEYKTIRGALDVLCNQICGIALDKGEVSLHDARKIIARSYSYKDMNESELLDLLSFMNKQHLVGFDGSRIAASGMTRMYYYSHLSFIPDTKRLHVNSIADNRVISSLDERFVAANLEEGSIFIVKGLPWRVVSIDEDRISVEPSEQIDGAIPSWVGEDIPVSYDIAHMVLEYIGGANSYMDALFEKGTLDRVRAFLERQRAVWKYSDDAVMVERAGGSLIIHSGLGTMANEALSRMLGDLVMAFTGKSVTVRSSPYLIVLEGAEDMNILDSMKKINTNAINAVLDNAIRDTELFRYHFITIAKFFGVIDRDSTVSKTLSKKILRVLADTPVYKETARELSSLMDVERVREFVGAIVKGKKKLVEVNNPELSPLTDEVLNSAYYTMELMMPLLPSKAVIESFSSFISNREAHLLCTYCGFHFSRKIKEIRDMKTLQCPSCGSVMLCRHSDAHQEIVKKLIAGKRLSKAEKRIFNGMMVEAGLLSSHGGKAVMALSTYGVGPSNAARVLMMQRPSDVMFYKDLIEAQKRFIRTKKYWKV
jgi:ATP-dependent Lhr-like helicase